MKNNFKRIGAFLLAFVMLIGIMPINAIAKELKAENAYDENIIHTSGLDLRDLNNDFVTPDYGNPDPNDPDTPNPEQEVHNLVEIKYNFYDAKGNQLKGEDIVQDQIFLNCVKQNC